MKKKFLSLALALVMSLGLALPAMAAEVVSADPAYVYEFSNEPIGTVEIESKPFFVLPDDTTISCKGKPDYDIVIEYSGIYIEDGQIRLDAFIDVGTAEDGKIKGGNYSYVSRIGASGHTWDTFNDMYIRIITESTVQLLGLTIAPYDPETLPIASDQAIAAAQTNPQATPQPSSSGTSASFADVKASDYFAAPVAWAVENGIASGTGSNKFSPNEECTIGQIHTFLWRAYGEPEPTVENPFGRQVAGHYFEKPSIWAYEKGLYTDSIYFSGYSCTRSMAVQYMWKAAGKPAPTKMASFSDVPPDAYDAQAISWAVEQGITSGTSATTFDRYGICTRGQIMTFLYRSLA